MSEKLRIYVKQTKDNRLYVQLLRAVCAALLFLAVLFACNSMFCLEYHVLWPICVGLVLILALTLFWESQLLICAIALVAAGFFAIGFLLRSRFAVNGLFVILNQCIRAIGTQTTRIFSSFSVNVSDDNMLLFATFFMVLFACLLAVLCAVIVNRRSKWALLLLAAVFLILTVMLGIAPGKKACAFLAFAFFVAICAVSMHTQQLRTYASALPTIALLLVVTVCGALVLAPSKSVSSVFFGLFDESESADGYPQGQLSSLKAHSETANPEETMLAVTMDSPHATYLRGYVGSYFDGENWCATDQTETYDNSVLFFWMHEQGCYAWNQIGRLYALADDADEAQAVSVENVHADSRYVYLPYETAVLADDVCSNLQMNNDETARSESGTRTYTFTAYDAVWEDTKALGTDLFYAQEAQSEDAVSYLEAESHYNVVVYALYTKLTEEQEALFDRLQSIEVDKDAAHISYDAANEYVQEFLSEYLTYDENASYAAADDDFLRSLLMEEKTGCDVHYATVAALYYRYLGIPARYVEGYRITAEDAAQMEAGEAYSLTSEHAHAWVEIYMDTIGWVPIELIK